MSGRTDECIIANRKETDMSDFQSPWTCTDAVDRYGMPMNRAILITDLPTAPIVALCPECRSIHRIARN